MSLCIICMLLLGLATADGHDGYIYVPEDNVHLAHAVWTPVWLWITRQEITSWVRCTILHWVENYNPDGRWRSRQYHLELLLLLPWRFNRLMAERTSKAETFREAHEHAIKELYLLYPHESFRILLTLRNCWLFQCVSSRHLARLAEGWLNRLETSPPPCGSAAGKPESSRGRAFPGMRIDGKRLLLGVIQKCAVRCLTCCLSMLVLPVWTPERLMTSRWAKGSGSTKTWHWFVWLSASSINSVPMSGERRSWVAGQAASRPLQPATRPVRLRSPDDHYLCQWLERNHHCAADAFS